MRKLAPLSKLLAFVLGRCPDQFGLVPDPDGFVAVKALLQALAEEQGWGHVRRGHLNELVMMRHLSPVEIVADRIRAVDRSRLPLAVAVQAVRGRLYVAVRRRAYGRVLTHGIETAPAPGLVLAADRQLALRIGRRRDPEPILIEVWPLALMAAGATLRCYGERLHLASALPPGCFSGPPLPRQRPVASRPQQPAIPPAPPHPGSFFPELGTHTTDRQRPPTRGKRQEPEWKRGRRRARRRPGEENN